MIRENPQGRCAMALDRLAPIQRVGLSSYAIEGHAYDERPPRQQHRQPQHRKRELAEIVAAGLDPETVSLEFQYDVHGNVRRIDVRERGTGRLVRVVQGSELARLSETGSPGALFERRG